MSMGFFRQESWSGLPFSSPGNLPDPGIELTSPVSPALEADSLPVESFFTGSPVSGTYCQAILLPSCLDNFYQS